MEIINIHLLSTIVSDYWSINQANNFAEGLSVGLERQGHKNDKNVILNVTGDNVIDYELHWEELNPKIHNSWQEPKKIAEDAATAIAFFLVTMNTEFNPREEALIGTGVDYWLAYKNTHPNFSEENFINGRLEISGINKESKTNTFAKRIKEKFEQTTPTDSTGFPVYVCVVELSNPKAFLEKK